MRLLDVPAPLMELYDGDLSLETPPLFDPFEREVLDLDSPFTARQLAEWAVDNRPMVRWLSLKALAASPESSQKAALEFWAQHPSAHMEDLRQLLTEAGESPGRPRSHWLTLTWDCWIQGDVVPPVIDRLLGSLQPEEYPLFESRRHEMPAIVQHYIAERFPEWPSVQDPNLIRLDGVLSHPVWEAVEAAAHLARQEKGSDPYILYLVRAVKGYKRGGYTQEARQLIDQGLRQIPPHHIAAAILRFDQDDMKDTPPELPADLTESAALMFVRLESGDVPELAIVLSVLWDIIPGALDQLPHPTRLNWWGQALALLAVAFGESMNIIGERLNAIEPVHGVELMKTQWERQFSRIAAVHWKHAPALIEAFKDMLHGPRGNDVAASLAIISSMVLTEMDTDPVAAFFDEIQTAETDEAVIPLKNRSKRKK